MKNKVAVTGFSGVVLAFVVCCTIAVQSLCGCNTSTPKAASNVATVPVMTAETAPTCCPANANAEISEAEYGKLVEMVQGYPELADAAAEALWADFNVTRNEYVAIWRQWRTLCQQTGHNKRMLLHEIITADPDGWAARVDRESADAPITSPAPIPVEKTE